MYYKFCKKLPELTINKPLSESMKMILKTIDPVKYQHLKLMDLKKHVKQKQNQRSSPW